MFYGILELLKIKSEMYYKNDIVKQLEPDHEILLIKLEGVFYYLKI